MNIAIGSDHAGFELKQILINELREIDDQVIDYGTDSLESCDYPDIAEPLAIAVARGEHDFGILICSNGVGPSIVANKIEGVRCGLCHDTFSARRAREHTNCNVLAMGARFNSFEEIKVITEIWFKTDFEGGRHLRRINKIEKL